ncbi:hypothetical protein BGW39_010693 [Mortierella sp. 14UC]|nr:hypothetical protein BGW39_010693 [Mortierella sp. 14UC]
MDVLLLISRYTVSANVCSNLLIVLLVLSPLVSGTGSTSRVTTVKGTPTVTTAWKPLPLPTSAFCPNLFQEDIMSQCPAPFLAPTPATLPSRQGFTVQLPAQSSPVHYQSVFSSSRSHSELFEDGTLKEQQSDPVPQSLSPVSLSSTALCVLDQFRSIFVPKSSSLFCMVSPSSSESRADLEDAPNEGHGVGSGIGSGGGKSASACEGGNFQSLLLELLETLNGGWCLPKDSSGPCEDFDDWRRIR